MKPQNIINIKIYIYIYIYISIINSSFIVVSLALFLV